MAVVIIAEEDRQLQVSASGVTTFTREMQLEGENLMEIATSPLVPQRGWRHPQNTAFFLDTIEISPNGNKGRKVQALATLTYNNSAELLKEFTEEPWELGAQNFSSSFEATSVAFVSGYAKLAKNPSVLNSGGWKVVQNVNTAGGRIEAETERYVQNITFTYSVKGKADKNFEGANTAYINKNSETVAGIKIEPLTGLLMPQAATFITEYYGNGEIKRQYWNVETTIRINPETWSKKELNVGTMCYFYGKDKKIVKHPYNIFSYTPWKSRNESDNMAVLPEFGSIGDVIRAKHKYAETITGVTYSALQNKDSQTVQKYQQAFDALPYSEVTEPMPLLPNGALDLQAIEDPQNYPYYVLNIFDHTVCSWSKFDLPKRRI